METAKQERVHRFRRNRGRQQKPYRITENDLDILRILARYRYLRTSFIFPLVGRKANTSGYLSLRKLFEHGYINKPREQHRGYNNLYTPDIYELDKKGADVLKERLPEATRLVRKRYDVPVKNFGHAMMICDTMASIELGINQTDCELITWQEIVERAGGENPMKLPCDIEHRFNGSLVRKSTFLHPDGLFGIRYPDGNTSFFALEAEHFNPINPTNLDRASFLKKFLGYRDIVKSGVYKKQLSIPNVRVLVVAPTAAKIQHMQELVVELVGQSNLFLFAQIPVQEEIFKAPPPFPELFEQEWQRAGHEPTNIC